MRWIVGIDLRDDCRGAIAVARWLDGVGGTRAPQHCMGVHVLPAGLRDDVLDQHVDEATEKARAAVKRAGAEHSFDRIDVVPGVEPEDSLAAAAGYCHAAGLIIGRHGPREGTTLVRLGRVARRLARRLPTPVMIVPPDYEPPDAVGPVVVLTDLQSDSVAAVRFAERMSQILQTDLVVLHVLRNPHAALHPTESVRASHDEAAVQRWLHGCGVSSAEPVTSGSDVVDAALNTAQTRKASLIVSGSRKLSWAERIYLSSTGTELSRFALRPVVLVPPEPDSP